MLFIPLLLQALIAFSIHANDDVMLIDSAFADYNGKTISLHGQVVVEHDLGKIAAETIQITPDLQEHKLQYHQLTMKDNVEITLKDGGTLKCARADINYDTKEGQFLSDASQEYVIYSENCQGKFPLVLKCQQMNVTISTENGVSGASAISQIVAQKSVTVNYNNDFVAAADFASYRRLPAEQDKAFDASQLTGLLMMHSDKQDGFCQVTNSRGDFIKSDHICIDTVKRHLLFAYPRGVIVGSKKDPERIDFSADTLTWDDLHNTLILRDNVVVDQPGIGTLTTDQEVRIKQHLVNGSKELLSIESVGHTVLTYKDPDKELTHTLNSYGTVYVDHEHLTTTMDSPLNADGKVPEGQQISFQDDMGEIRADKLTIFYTLINNKPSPTKLVLDGNIKILNRGAIDPSRTHPFLQYAMADQVEYTPQAKEICLSAKPGKRVLFFDKINNLQVSAPALKIRRDQTTKKESVQGIGDVRFSFVERELDQMMQHFNLNKDSI